MTVPLEQGRPIWVDDDRFDISYHVRLTALPDAGLVGAAARAHRADPGAAARPVAPAVGAVVRRGARGRPRRADAEDAPRARRRRVGRRRRHRAARLRTRIPTPLEPAGWIPQPPPSAGRSSSWTRVVERSTEPAEIVRTVAADLRGRRSGRSNVATASAERAPDARRPERRSRRGPRSTRAVGRAAPLRRRADRRSTT